ncbi:MAG: hypothetical protein Q9188_006470 [Gyalolechia gomerana]
MPSKAHEELVVIGDIVFSELQRQNWQHQGTVIEFEKRGTTGEFLTCESEKRRDVMLTASGAECKLKLPDNRRLKHQPDYSIAFPETKFPFLILEVALSQNDKSINEKAHNWVQGNRGHMRVFCLLKMRPIKGTSGHIVTCTIIKPYRTAAPTVQHPNGYVVRPHMEIDDQEIWPSPPDGLSFTIRLSDVLPKGDHKGSNYGDQSVQIPLSLFYPHARLAANSIGDDDDPCSSSDSDQQPPSSPGSSRSSLSEIADEEFVEPEDSETEDPSYVEHP